VSPPLRVEGASAVHRDGDPVKLRLARISQRAQAHRKEAFNNLFTHMDGEMLLYALEQLEDGKAAGVDGINVEEYEQGLEARLTSLLDRLHREAYRPQPSRRRWIPVPPDPSGGGAMDNGESEAGGALRVLPRERQLDRSAAVSLADAQGPVLGPQSTQPAPQLHVARVRGLRRPLPAGDAAACGQPESGTDGGNMVAGSRMRERRTSGSERGQGVNRGGEALVKHGCGGSLTNTREDGGGSPAGLAKNSGPTR